jgi:hypothetical protein
MDTKQVILTLGGNNVPVVVPKEIEPKPKKEYTQEEIGKMNESWERSHFQMEGK